MQQFQSFLKHNENGWDEHARVHTTKISALYDRESFVQNKIASTLLPAEEGELSPYIQKGTTMLHLMCHIGLDSLSWAKKGARVVGMDFSEEAVISANKTAEELGLKEQARFIRSNAYDAKKNLGDYSEFDVVFTSYGILCWLPDLTSWAKVIASCLKPGGIFYIAEVHPFSCTLEALSPNVSSYDGKGEDKEGTKLIYSHDYFYDDKPVEETSDWTYAGVQMSKTCTMYEWQHTLSDVINAVTAAGLSLTFVHEYPWSCFQRFPFMKQKDGKGPWFLPDGVPKVPLTFTLMARKPSQ